MEAQSKETLERATIRLLCTYTICNHVDETWHTFGPTIQLA